MILMNKLRRFGYFGCRSRHYKSYVTGAWMSILVKDWYKEVGANHNIKSYIRKR